VSADLQIRVATPEDAAVVAGHRYPGEVGEHLAVYAAWLPGVMAEGRYFGWLAVQGERVVAGAGLLIVPWQPSRTDPRPVRGRAVNVFVEPGFRRRGVARSLLIGVLAEARRLEMPGVGLSATAQGRSLYVSLGFRDSVGELYLELKTDLDVTIDGSHRETPL
jgi:GNAT superfamily N-acetyltransferase